MGSEQHQQQGAPPASKSIMPNRYYKMQDSSAVVTPTPLLGYNWFRQACSLHALWP